MKIINFINRLPPRLILFFSLILIGLIGAIDYVIKIDIALSIFYLVPITLITWFVNQKWGVISSVGSSISWFIADLHVKVYDYWWLPYWNVSVRLGFFIITVSLLATLKKSYEYQKQLARTDFLTGLMNRNFFLELLQLESLRSLRYQRPLTLVYLDLDDFKLINDRHGHHCGDNLLKLITQTIQKEIRTTDIFARFGGDEFALLLPETNYESAQIVLKRISLCCQQITQAELSLVGLSMGAITFIQPLNSISEMLHKVDLLMYEVKQAGKNNFKHELI
ncbi:diguanylate cyclase [Stanieria sp. NIES-3757]|nr:diguanylate cyclase [Stanieria sp. NIES-3757]